MLPYDENITAWLLDAATRNRDIQHDPADPKKKRFFEMEWEEMMQNATQLSATHFCLVLEDYKEQFRDNDADYISSTPVIAFMILRAVTTGRVEEVKTAYKEARRIALSITGKLKQDTIDHNNECEADVPPDVVPPKLLDYNTLSIQKVRPPMFLHAFGVRAVMKLRLDHEVTLGRVDADWLPLA